MLSEHPRASSRDGTIMVHPRCDEMHRRRVGPFRHHDPYTILACRTICHETRDFSLAPSGFRVWNAYVGLLGSHMISKRTILPVIEVTVMTTRSTVQKWHDLRPLRGRSTMPSRITGDIEFGMGTGTCRKPIGDWTERRTAGTTPSSVDNYCMGRRENADAEDCHIPGGKWRWSTGTRESVR